MATGRQSMRRGFTLIEAVATMTVLSVVSVLASRIIFAATSAYAAEATRAELSFDLSAAMERVAGELRSIPSVEGGAGTPWIDSVAAGSISFGNGSQIALSGTNLQVTVAGGSARTLLAQVTGFALACFDERGQSLALPMSGAACGTVRKIQVSITRTRAGVSETLRTRVYLRCAMAGSGS